MHHRGGNLMKSAFLTAFIAATSFISAAAYADPASYHDKAWANFIEKGAVKQTPSGFPTGNGAISRVHGNEVWPKSFAILTSPTDMSRVASIQLSDYAYWDGRYYASESMTAFLVASAQKLQKLTKRADIKIPVYLLAYNANVIPTPHVTDLLEVQLGLFLKGDRPIPTAEIATDGEVTFEPSEQSYDGKLYEAYVATVLDVFQDFKEMSHKEISEDLTFYYDTSSPITHVSDVEDMPNLKLDAPKYYDDPLRALYEREYEINQKYDAPIKALGKQFREADSKDRPKILHKIRLISEERRDAHGEAFETFKDRIKIQDTKTAHPFDEQIRALEEQNRALPRQESSADQRRILIEEITRLKKEKQAALRALRTNAHEAVQKAHQNDPDAPAASKSDSTVSDPLPGLSEDLTADYQSEPKEIDIETTWLMFEAMLSQNAETVMMIKLPGTLRARLISHAQNAKRPAKIIETFKDIAVTTRNETITLQLACSIRDRFLGCPGRGSAATEKKVTQIAQKILNNAKSASLADKLQAIQLVINAAPDNIKNPIDLANLVSEQKAIYDQKSLTRVNNRIDFDRDNAAEDDFKEMISDYKKICNINIEDEDSTDSESDDEYKSSSRCSDGTGSLDLPF